MSAAAAVPFAGWGATVGKWGKRVEHTIELSKDEKRVFRQGKFSNGQWEGNVVKGKQWSRENPLSTPDFAEKHGLPIENTGNPDWVVQGRVEGSYSTKPSPPGHNAPANTGGAMEIIPQDIDSVRVDWFHMR